MQNAFMLTGVAFVEIKPAPDLVPNINRLAAAMRAAGGTVVWIVTTYTDEVSTDWSTYYRSSTQESGDRRSGALVKGTEGPRIWKELDVVDGEPVIEKTKFSATSDRLRRESDAGLIVSDDDERVYLQP